MKTIIKNDPKTGCSSFRFVPDFKDYYKNVKDSHN